MHESPFLLTGTMRVAASASGLLRRLAASATLARPARSVSLRCTGIALHQAELRSETLQLGTERGWREFGSTAAAGAGATGASRDWVLH